MAICRGIRWPYAGILGGHMAGILGGHMAGILGGHMAGY